MAIGFIVGPCHLVLLNQIRINSVGLVSERAVGFFFILRGEYQSNYT